MGWLRVYVRHSTMKHTLRVICFSQSHLDPPLHTTGITRLMKNGKRGVFCSDCGGFIRWTTEAEEERYGG